MKKTIFIIAFLAVISHVSAQFTIGPKIGLNISKEHGEKLLDEDVDFRTGFNAGVFGRYEIGNKFDIQAELLYSQQGYKSDLPVIDYGGTKIFNRYKVLSHYLNVPVILKYYPVKNLFIEAGPQIGFCIDSKISPEDKDLEKLDIPYNTVDFSLAGGIGVYLGQGFSFNARYNHGFTETMEKSKWKNRVIQLSLTYDLFSF